MALISQPTIQSAAELLLEAAPGSTVILFGSYARGDAGPDSDVDFLVVEPQVPAWRTEMVRLRDVLRPLRIPVDVLVVGRDRFHEWSQRPGSVYHDAATEGQVLRGSL